MTETKLTTNGHEWTRIFYSQRRFVAVFSATPRQSEAATNANSRAFLPSRFQRQALLARSLLLQAPRLRLREPMLLQLLVPLQPLERLLVSPLSLLPLQPFSSQPLPDFCFS
jgi:hypothetical protein